MARSSALLFLVASCYRPQALPSLAPASVVAQVAATRGAPAGETWALDEDAAVGYALEHGPQLADRADAEAVADARIAAASQLQNPELRIGQSSDDRLLGTSSRFGVAVRVHPDAPWTLSARVARARAERDAERARTASTARTVVAEIRELYAELAFGEAMQAMLERQLAVLGDRNRVLAERMQHAAATRLENLLASHDLADLESTKTAVELDLVRARSKLALVVGIPPGQAWRAVADHARLVSVRTGLDAAGLSQRAIATQPELAESAARANAAGAAAYLERTRRLPVLDWVQVERATSPEVEWSVGASLTLPLLSLDTGKIAAAAAEQRRHLHDRDRLAAATLHRVRAAVELVEATGKHARELAARVAPLNEEIEALLERERSAAVADPLKLLLLEERHVRAQRDLLDASYAHRRALIELEQLIGGPP